MFFTKKKSFKNVLGLGQFLVSDAVLDVGGGSGKVAKYFVGKVARIVVADPSEEAIGACRRKGLEAVVAPAQNLPFEDNVFDKAILVNDLHHMENLEGAAEEVFRVLKSGGLLVVQEPAPNNAIVTRPTLLRWLMLDLKDSSCHIVHDSPFMKNLFDQAGFSTEVVQGPQHYYYLVARKN